MLKTNATEPNAEQIIAGALGKGPAAGQAGAGAAPQLAKPADSAGAGTKDGEGDATAGQGDAGKPEKKPAAPAGFVSLDDVHRIVQEGIQKAMAEQTKQTNATNFRERFIREKLSDWPLSYQDLIPQTSDKTALEKAAHELGNELNAWFEKAFKATLKQYGQPDFRNVGGVSRDGGTVPGRGLLDAVDRGMFQPKGTPEDDISRGLDQRR